MKNLFLKISLIQAFRQATSDKEIPTLLFYLILILTCLFLLNMPFCPWAQDLIMNKFHLKTKSFAKWSALQFIPSMYNFSNEIWMSSEPIFKDFDRDERYFNDIYVHYWMNHYPLRYTSFNLHKRKKFFQSGHSYYVYLKSSYQGNKLTSIYHLKSTKNSLYLEEFQ